MSGDGNHSPEGDTNDGQSVGPDLPQRDSGDPDKNKNSGLESNTPGDTDTDSIVRSLGKSGAVILLGTFVELGAALVAKLLIARELTAVSYGEVTVGLTILTVTAIISRLGFETGIPRNAPRYDGAERRGVFVSALQLNVIVCSILSVGLFLAAGQVAEFLNNQQLRPVLRVIAVGVPAIPLMRVSLGGIQAVGRSVPKVIVQNLTHPLTRIGFVSVAVVVGANPVLIAGAYVLSNWIAAIAALYFLFRYTPIFDRSIDWTPKYREMLVFSLPLMATTGLSFILGNTDTLMLQYFLGSEAVGLYDIGYTIAQMLTVGVGALSYLFLPNISSLQSDGEIAEITHLYKLVTKWIGFITIPPYLVVIFFPEVIISVFGDEFVSGAPYLVILASAYFVNAITGPNKEILASSGDTKFILYVNVFAAALNLILNLLLILSIGTIGAAIASGISLIAIHLIYCIRIYQSYGVSPYSRSAIRPVLPLLGLSAIGYIIRQNIQLELSIFRVVVLSVLIGAIYSTVILSFGGLQEDDVMLVRSAEQSLGVDLEPIKKIARKLM